MIKYSILLDINNISKAYMQNLLSRSIFPEHVIILNDNKSKKEHTNNDRLLLENTKQKFLRFCENTNLGFDEKEHTVKTLIKYNIPYTLLDTMDINSKIVLDNINKLKSKYVLCSFANAQYLNNELLKQKYIFLNVQIGDFSNFDANNTLYYSMLVEKTTIVSIYTVVENSTDYKILYQKEFLIDSKNEDFDYLLAPTMKASTFIEFLENDISEKFIENKIKDKVFYTIHPVIKHLSILKIKKEKLLL